MGQIREVEPEGMGIMIRGAATLSVAELQHITRSGCLQDVQRVRFFLLLLFTEGTGKHMVDFVSYPVRPNTLIFVQPGQVQQFCLNDTLKGQLIVITPAFLRPEVMHLHGSPFHAGWPVCTELPDDLAQRFLVTAADISADSAGYGKHPISEMLLHHQLCTLLLRLRLCMEGTPPLTAPGRVYSLVSRFKELVEEEYLLHRSVPYYAERLNCSQKTLTQACVCAEARTAKAILVERTLLEAKRLLAHGQDGVAQVAQQLGFGETTNFIRFFKMYAQATPAQFRAQHRYPYEKT